MTQIKSVLQTFLIKDKHCFFATFLFSFYAGITLSRNWPKERGSESLIRSPDTKPVIDISKLLEKIKIKPKCHAKTALLMENR